MRSIYALSSLDRIKDHLGKTNVINDTFLQSLLSIATTDIEQYTGRNLRERSYGLNGLGAEYHNGKSGNKLYASHYPILSVTSIYDDIDRNYTSATLKPSTDYVIWKDEGIIQLLDDATQGTSFDSGIQNIKLSYTAGYGEFEVITNINDKLDITDTGSSVGIVLDAGVYTAVALTTEIQSKLNSSVGLEYTYTASYDPEIAKFTISTANSFTLQWSTGTNKSFSIGRTIGFDNNADSSSAATYTSDHGVLGIPSDLEMACIQLVMRLYKESGMGADRFDTDAKISNVAGQSNTTKFNSGSMPKFVRRILDRYRAVTYLENSSL